MTKAEDIDFNIEVQGNNKGFYINNHFEWFEDDSDEEFISSAEAQAVKQ